MNRIQKILEIKNFEKFLKLVSIGITRELYNFFHLSAYTFANCPTNKKRFHKVYFGYAQTYLQVCEAIQ